MLKPFRRVLFWIGLVLAGALIALTLSSQGFWNVLMGNVGVTYSIDSLLTSVQDLAQLTSTRFVYDVEVTVARDLPASLAPAFGEEITMQAVGFVNAGVDLDTLTESDITVNGDTLVINLPAPALLDCFFNESESVVIGERRAIFANYPQDIQILARQAALIDFRDSALEDGILDEARLQSTLVVENFVRAAAGGRFDEVIVSTRPVDPTAPYPESCE